ncbi:hypothetical protein E4T48_08484 [Aureobasidium sp. EXF-10727]|nr:hypothetical protein E4T48_08484 [Aureobasidium sp. EXF-10727]
MAPSPPTAFAAKYYEPFDNLMKTSAEKINSGSHGCSASFDDALAAFAQFICLRLRVSRCLVSCFDRNNQYILAEATPTLSLKTDKADDPKDELWLGSGIQERHSLLCERTLELADNKLDSGPDGVVVVPNIADDDWYKSCASRMNVPDNVCFYAGTAIRSPYGPVIGVISVLDHESRDDLAESEKDFLQYMSSTIMTHLDMVRSKEEHRRASQMIVGLGSFVEGKGLVDMHMHSKTVPKSTNVEHQGEPPLTPGASTSRPPEMVHIQNENPPQQPDPTKSAEDTLSFEDLQAQMLSTDVKSTFQRAAQIIKDAIDVEGVVFLDASVGSFGALVQSVPASSEDDSASYFTRNTASKKECHVLGSAGESDHGFSITEGFLHSFLTRYGQGRIFNIDPIETELHMTNAKSPEESEDFGQKLEPDEEQHSDDEKRDEVRRQRSADIAELKRLFPDARSLAFVPMWDDHRMRWFCGGIVWSNRAIRLLHKDSELSFLRAFGMSIMSEVAKLDTAMADKAKSDLLNSISHELRSPLHGILGSIECLESSDLDPMQHGLVETVDTCGRTLLDTINHLLDFSKINNFTRNKSKRQKDPTTRQADMLSLDSVVHLPTITEEALETVFAGYSSSAGAHDVSNNTQASKDNTTLRRDVEVIVDIEAKDHENWLLCTEGGAWKRLVMNLTGNSLKYTNDGFIYIRLSSQELPKNSEGSRRSRISLTVKDTGKGMSKEYLQNHLFRPFAQEDPLNPGAGLGLSMVRHIVSNLGGEISVESELNKGTEIRVEIIMMDSVPGPEANDEAFVMTEAAQKLHGLKAAFIDPPISSDGETSSQRSLRKALDKQCWGWFKMEFTTVSGVEEVEDATVVLTTCYNLPSIKDQLIKLNKPLIVLCESNVRLRQVYAESEALRRAVTTEFIAQPYGPRKLARAFVTCKEQKPPQLEDIILYRDTELMTLPSMPAPHTQAHNQNQSSTSQEATPPRVARSQSKAAEEPQGPAKQEGGARAIRLLLVDDNKINLQLLVRYCKSKKHDYVTAEDGVEAVQAFSSHQQDAATKFDFVCMDISMPRMDGLEATRRIRSFEQSNGMEASKIIALTGLASAEAQQEAFSSGVDQFMTKPVRLKELGEVLAGRR